MLFDLASPRATSITPLTTATVALRTAPMNLTAADKPLFEKSLKYEIAPSQLLQLDDVTALGNGWLYQKLTLLKDSFIFVKVPSQSRQLKTIPKRIIAGLSAEKIDKGAWITDNWSQNYFHWLTDAIPRLYLAKQYDPDINLLLPSFFQSVGYTEESLEPFNLTSVRIIPEDHAVFVKKFQFPTYSAVTGNYNESVIRPVGEIYRRHFGVPASTGRRIYISRSKAPVRNVINENEIVPILARHGFEIVHCENMSFSEQVKIFSEASMIAGPHGAGLVNMMFMHPGAKVLEIHPRDNNINLCYFSMTSAFEHSYFYMLSDTACRDVPSYHNSMVIDLEELDKNLALMCANQ